MYSVYVNTLLSGAPVAVCAPSSRGHGDESGYCGETYRHTVPQDLHSETWERQVWWTPCSTRFTFTRTSGVVDTIFYKIYTLKIMRMSGMVDTLSTRFSFTRMPGVIETLFYKIYIQKHENVRYGEHPFHKISFHKNARYGRLDTLFTRSTFKNMMTSSMVDSDTLFHKISFHENDRCGIDTLFYKIYTQKHENVR